MPDQPRAVRRQHRHLRHAVVAHQRDDVAHRLALARGDQRALLLRAQQLDDRAQRIGLVEEAVLAHPLVVEDLGQVLGRAVGEQHQDVLLALARLRVLDRARDRRARAAAHEQAFLPHQLARHQEALLVVDAHDLVDDLQVHGAGQEVLADALDVVRERARHPSGLDVLVVERADRIDADQAKAGLLLLEEAPAARRSCRRSPCRPRTRRPRRPVCSQISGAVER